MTMMHFLLAVSGQNYVLCFARFRHSVTLLNSVWFPRDIHFSVNYHKSIRSV